MEICAQVKTFCAVRSASANLQWATLSALPQSLLKQDISAMPLSFQGLLKWFIGVVSVLLLSGLSRSTAQGQTLLAGGGATFPHPIYARWIAEFQKLHPDFEIEHNAIGSGRGSEKLQQAFTISGRVTDRWMTLSSKIPCKARHGDAVPHGDRL
jgi:ABC-type phosphate transport system substrate-binding protein